MSKHSFPSRKNRSRFPSSNKSQIGGSRRTVRTPRRGDRGGSSSGNPFVPPEDWYEPLEDGDESYDIVVQNPGPGFSHILTPDEIRERLDALPGWMLEPLEIIQLSRMTRKKRRFPCYGMQWGSSLYLYPLESSLVEHFSRPPKPAQRTEARMYGGRWIERPANQWELVWNERSIKDYYLNNILIHELGHLLDDRNTSYVDRERYAEWFAIQHGYKSSDANGRRRVRRRHHGKAS